ncbi:type 1 glutamine amidotransferase domain-containing protein [Pendulispora rubella]|uniref:Type 1 glutamine amidotransferase domain-containing protein n=1 Tax=Pendulispora rubella TaxID=2741070 RepID=A0ABZ2KT30_9BACT
MTASQSSPQVSRGKVLVVLSSTNSLPLRDHKEYKTGYFLNEMMVPVKAIVDAGLQPVFANPQGTTPVMDPHSDDPSFFGGNEQTLRDYKAFRDRLEGFSTPRKLRDVVREGLDGYVGVFFPGGHAPMGDLLQDSDVGATLQYFHAKGKPTGLICHGPIALLAASSQPPALVEAIAANDSKKASELARGWIYAGYRMTAFSTAEEKTAEEGGTRAFLGGKVRFYPDEALRMAGGNVETAPPGKSHVVHDRELFTGQQPFSDAEFAAQFLPALLAGLEK